jgi:hypothetical protein
VTRTNGLPWIYSNNAHVQQAASSIDRSLEDPETRSSSRCTRSRDRTCTTSCASRLRHLVTTIGQSVTLCNIARRSCSHDVLFLSGSSAHHASLNACRTKAGSSIDSRASVPRCSDGSKPQRLFYMHSQQATIKCVTEQHPMPKSVFLSFTNATGSWGCNFRTVKVPACRIRFPGKLVTGVLAVVPCTRSKYVNRLPSQSFIYLLHF